MTENNTRQLQLVDHFIQVSILKKLSEHPEAVRFSDLKDDDIENSLFMYHANKLLDRGLIEKSEDGFKITVKGARFVNNANESLMSQQSSPKMIVQLVITFGDQILLARRKGALKELLNEYLLPGGFHIFGKTAANSAKEILNKIIDTEQEPKFKTLAEIIYSFKDGYNHHTISQIFNVSLNEKCQVNEFESYEYIWVPISEINSENQKFQFDNFLKKFFEKYPDLEQRELFTFNEQD